MSRSPWRTATPLLRLCAGLLLIVAVFTSGLQQGGSQARASSPADTPPAQSIQHAARVGVPTIRTDTAKRRCPRLLCLDATLAAEAGMPGRTPHRIAASADRGLRPDQRHDRVATPPPRG